MKRVFVVHGWKGKPTSNWFPWLKGELVARKVSVEIPQMPGPTRPTQSKWLAHLEKVVGQPDSETFFVTHSLGGIAVLRYLESLPASTKIGGLVLVAGFPESIGRPEITTFFKNALDFHKVRRMARGYVVAIHSNNDNYVSFHHGETLRDRLGAKLITIPNGGHLNANSGYFTLPIVLDELIAMGC